MGYKILTRLDAVRNYPHIEKSLDEGFASSPSSRTPSFKVPDWIHAGQTGHYHLAQEPFYGLSRIVCPGAGTILMSEYGWVQTLSGWIDIVYAFRSDSLGLIYLYTSSFDQCKLALVIPKEEVVVLSGLWGNIVKNTLSDVVNLAHKDFHYGNNAELDIDQTSGIIDTFAAYQSNLGHYFWNDVAGVSSLLSAGEGHQIRLNLGPYQYLPLLELLDPSTINGVVLIQSQRFEWKKYLKPLRIPGQRISLSLRRRVINHAISKSNAQWRDLNLNSFVLLFNVRNHNKVWRDQVQGLKIALNAIRSRFAGMSITLVIDGTPDCKGVVGEIKNIVELHYVDLIDGTNVPMVDSLCYALAADLAISCVGSGLALSSWLAGAKCIAHGNVPHLSQKTFWNYISETSPSVLFLPYGSVQPIKSLIHSSIDQSDKSSYSDYDVNPTLFKDALVSALEEMSLKQKRIEFLRAKELIDTGNYEAALDYLV